MTMPTGAPAGGTSPEAGAGAPAPASTPTPGAAPANQPAFTPQPGGQQTPVPGQQFQQGGNPEDHRIRSILQSARQSWEQENSDLFQLRQILQENGRDPRQVVQEYQAARQQYEQQQRLQQQGLGQVDPGLARTLMGLQQEIETLRTNDMRREGFRALQEAETANAALAQQMGIDYKTIVNDVRQYALQNEITVDLAFKTLYFDRFVSAQRQQAQGEQLAALQGRGQGAQPFTSAVPGSVQTGPVNYMNMSSKDFREAQIRMRQGS